MQVLLVRAAGVGGSVRAPACARLPSWLAQLAYPALPSGQARGVKRWVHALNLQVVFNLLGEVSLKGRTHSLKDQVSTQHHLQSPGGSHETSSDSCSSVFKSSFKTFDTSLSRFGRLFLTPSSPSPTNSPPPPQPLVLLATNLEISKVRCVHCDHPKAKQC